MTDSLVKMFSRLCLTDIDNEFHKASHKEPEKKTEKLGFLSLPPELRQMVYKHAIPSATYVQVPIGLKTVHASSDDDMHTTLSLANACRTTHAEFAHLYYQNSLFVFCDNDDARALFAAVGRNAPDVRRIHILDPMQEIIGNYFDPTVWSFADNLTSIRLDFPASVADNARLPQAVALWMTKTRFCPEEGAHKYFIGGGRVPMEILKQVIAGTFPAGPVETRTHLVEKMVLAVCPGHDEGSIFKGKQGDLDCKCRGGVKYRKLYKVLWEMSCLSKSAVLDVYVGYRKKYADGQWRIKTLEEDVPEDAE
ncbi:hypothetical protein KVT40_007985 [Elsinoe batatas]|uniref:2EXR domain-containing protein n=1 Tax=Elsinoe batatas TaxID=2601811 RepID=A0A8K0PEX9_9PEZI|nr:hypothetical protein KVT40_007985 [Elsinoe batatas]